MPTGRLRPSLVADMPDKTTSDPAPGAKIPPFKAGRRSGRPGPGRRTHALPSFSLVELAPQWVVEGKAVASGIVAPDVAPTGACREVCPHCGDVPLMLVLRAQHIVRTHLFCEKCTRCFDVVYPDGVSAFTPVAVPIE